METLINDLKFMPKKLYKIGDTKKTGKVGKFSLKVTQLSGQRKVFLKSFGSLLNSDKKIAQIVLESRC